MDGRARETLELIERAVEMVPAQRGRQLVMVARDYAAAGEPSTARRIIINIRDYFASGRAYLEMQSDDLLRQALFDLADVFPGIAGSHSRFAIPVQETKMADVKQEDPESIEPLPPVPSIERVITEEEGKTFRVRACLVRTIEGPFETFRFAGFVFANPVPVVSADGKEIGFAALQWDGTQLMADVVIDYASQERLLIETGERLYARPEGRVARMTDGKEYIDFQEPVEIGAARVDKLRLTGDAPYDGRIDPLGKPVA